MYTFTMSNKYARRSLSRVPREPVVISIAVVPATGEVVLCPMKMKGIDDATSEEVNEEYSARCAVRNVRPTS